MTTSDENSPGKKCPSGEDLLAFIESQLYTAVISDALDELGVRDRAMAETLRPLAPDSVFAGWARTMSCVDVYDLDHDPYAMEIEAVDSILKDEVVVVATGESKRNAPWGELLSTAARARGARGAVVDGLVRDVRKINALGFPVFAAGIKPVDSQGRGVVWKYNVPVVCAGIHLEPGDLIVADYDGVVAVPADLAERTVQLASKKALLENDSRADLEAGAYLRDVYAKYGVL